MAKSKKPTQVEETMAYQEGLHPIDVFEQLGSLQLYTLRTEEDDLQKRGIMNIYWRDNKSPQGFGPFPSLWEALSHYRDICRVYQGNSSRDDIGANVVAVDFVMKRRI